MASSLVSDAGPTTPQMSEDGPSRRRTGGTAFVHFSVSDTGIGIDSQHMTRIFEPFEQGDDSLGRAYQGTGLGLSLTKRLVELHGGSIWAESEGEGKGSRFTFMIPILL